MKTIKIRKIGNSYGFTISKELIKKYNLKEGDVLHLIENEDGFSITPYNPEFQKWSEHFKRTKGKYKNTLKALS